MLGRGLLLVPRRAGDGVGGGRRGTTRGAADGRRLGDVSGASPTSVSHGHDGRSHANSGRKIPVHPYLARQMSDFGFRQTLEVRTLGCARRFRLLPTCTPPRRQDLSYGKNNTRDTGFILVRPPLWCNTLLQCVAWWIASWADDERYKGRTASREVFLSWCDELLG